MKDKFLGVSGAITRGYRWLEIKCPRAMTLLLSVLTIIFLSLFQFHLKKLFGEVLKEEPNSLWQGLKNIYDLVALCSYSPKAWGYFGAALVSGLLTYLIFLLLYKIRYQIYDLKITNIREPKSKRVVIMALSLPHDLQSNMERFQELPLEQACVQKGRFQWQQNLRVLHHHLKDELPAQYGYFSRLWQMLPWVKQKEPAQRHIIVLPSKEGCAIAEGYSKPYIDLFIELARGCIKNSKLEARMPEFHKEDGVDYNNLEQQDQALRDIIHKVRISETILAEPREISIDVSAGTKQTSIAAAAVTFASPMEFSHIEQDTNKFLAFDVTASLKKGE